MNFDPATFQIPAQAYPVPAILDTDTFNEIDDQFALVYALLSPDRINLKGVTAAPFLNERSTSPGDGMEKSYDEICRILDLLECRDRVPAYRGSTEFMRNPAEPVRSEAADFIIAEARRARQRGEKLFVMAIGAITNVASALALAPDIAADIVIVWLGGNAYDFDHNREFNLYQDIVSSQLIHDCAAPFVRIPCSRVASVLRTNKEKIAVDLANCGKVGDYLKTIFNEFMDQRQQENKVIWDISAVSYLTIPEATQWEIVPRPKLEDDSSWSFPPNQNKMLIARQIDPDRLFADFYRRLRDR